MRATALAFLVKVVELKIKNNIPFFLIFLLVALGLIKFTNLVALEYINSDGQYENIYKERFEKGYLTDKDLIEIKEMEKTYSMDLDSRDERFNKFYGVFSIGMLLCFFMSFLFGNLILSHCSLFAIVTSFLIVAIVAGGLLQSVFWLLFFCCGLFFRNKSLTR